MGDEGDEYVGPESSPERHGGHGVPVRRDRSIVSESMGEPVADGSGGSARGGDVSLPKRPVFPRAEYRGREGVRRG